MKNYISLGKTTLGNWVRYLFLDTEDFLVKSLIIRHMIHVKTECVLSRKDEEYQFVLMKVQKKDEQLFLRAMEELKGKMLLFGHRDYESHGAELLNMTRELMKADAEKTGRVQLPLGGSVPAGEIGW